MIRRLLRALAALTVVAALAGCLPAGPNDEPGCDGADTSTGQCGWGLNFQNQAGQPIVWIDYQLPGDTTWRHSPKQNCNNITRSDGTCRAIVYSPAGRFVALVAKSGSS